MPQIILDQAEIIATVRQGIATAMPQHMGMYMKRQPRALAAAPYQIVDRKAGELISPVGPLATDQSSADEQREAGGS